MILIGGTSHVGKSTLATSLASELGWEHRSTDKLARHPGRPWSTTPKPVPEHVAEHYATLSADQLIADVLNHYKMNVMPQVTAILNARTTDPAADGLVLEGSALWPEYVAQLPSKNTLAVWLTASDDRLTSRIHEHSRYAQATDQGQHLIQKFVDRTLLYNRRMLAAITTYHFPLIDVEAATGTEQQLLRIIELFEADASTNQAAKPAIIQRCQRRLNS